MQKSERAFTLIELLVVIAIIGLLATIVLIALSSSRVKSRDAHRIASLQEMAKAIALLDTGPAVTFTGCTGAGTSAAPGAAGGTNDASSCNGPSNIDFTKYKDPYTPGTLCTNTSTQACQFMIARQGGGTGNPTSQDFEICTYVETPSISNTIGPGRIRIDSLSGGSVVNGCN